jgi:hypothetical protein
MSFPRGCLNPDGTYDLWCCDDVNDNPCDKAHQGVSICLGGKALMEFGKQGEVSPVPREGFTSITQYVPGKEEDVSK